MRKIRKGDRVVLVTGKNVGKIGEVLRVFANQRVLVDGLNLVKKHLKVGIGDGVGIKSQEATIHVSNVALLNEDKQKGERIRFVVLEDGRKTREFVSVSNLSKG